MVLGLLKLNERLKKAYYVLKEKLIFSVKFKNSFVYEDESFSAIYIKGDVAPNTIKNLIENF